MFFLLTIESVVLLKNKQTRKGTLTLFFYIYIFWGGGELGVPLENCLSC